MNRKEKIIENALSGLIEYYSCLNDTTLASELCSVLVVPDTGNDQNDYENVRNQLERMALCNEKTLDEGVVTVLVLGELVVASVYKREKPGTYHLYTPGTFLRPHVVENNKYLTVSEAIQAAKMLIPKECREFVRELPSVQ